MTVRRAAMMAMGALSILASLLTTEDAQAAEVIRVATLAPKKSPWGQVFSLWEGAVKEKSGGQIEIQFSYNGMVDGQDLDEAGMVEKMKAGKLDGAAVTAVGLSKIYKPILALQLPGLFKSWAKLDAARDAMKGEFEKGVKAAGFTLAGWGDVGQVRIMSKGIVVRTPGDLRDSKPYMWRDDFMAPALYDVLGAKPVPLSVPEVLPMLIRGGVNVVMTATLAVEQLQWAPRLDNIVSTVSSSRIGALVFSNKRLDALPADLRKIVVDTGRIAAAALTTRIRNEDSAAFDRLKEKMTVITLTDAESAKWDAAYKRARQKLAMDEFSPELVEKLEALSK